MGREILVEHEFGKLEMELYMGIPILHLQVTKWSHTIFKKIMLPLWAITLQDLKDRGYNVVLAIIPETETKIAKFHALLGMHEADRGHGHIVSRRWL